MNKSIFNKNGFVKRPNPKAKTKFTTHTLDPRLPEFIRLHPIFKHHPIEKKFEEHGLSDFTIKIPDTSLSVIFSTSPFDIATMSMRGTTSCMRWGNTSSSSLIGSIIDPYCGLIYITDGKQVSLSDERDGWEFEGKKTPRATKIVARSVVRLVHSVGAGKDFAPALERLYGLDRINDSDTIAFFQRVLHKTSNKVAFVLTRNNSNHWRIPSSPAIDELRYYDIRDHWANNKGWMSYRDSQVLYGDPAQQMKKALLSRQYSLPTDEDDGNE